MKTDIQIAQEATLKPIKEVATLLGICEDDLELYGKYKAKISEELMDYLNDTDLDYGERIVFYKLVNMDDNYYNDDIVEYFNNCENISYEQESEILEYLGMKVDNEGNVKW